MRYRVSVSNGRGSLRHNNREFVAENVDKNRIKDNVTLERMSLTDAYKMAYGESIDKYNEQQKRKDRKLTVDKYMKRIESGQGKKNNPKLFYETVIQIGDVETAGIKQQPKTAEEMKQILACYYEDLKERTKGHILFFNAVIHMDESTPHLHVNWLPLGKGFKKGMPIRNSLEKAIGQMGKEFKLPDNAKNAKVNNRAKWQEFERDKLCEIAKARGIDAFWERHETPELKMTPQEYKKFMRVVVRELVKQYDMHKDEAEKVASELKKGNVLKRIFNKSKLFEEGISEIAKAETLAKMVYEAKQQELSASLAKEHEKNAQERESLAAQRTELQNRQLEFDNDIADFQAKAAEQSRANQEKLEQIAEERAKLEAERKENERLHNESMRNFELAEKKEREAKRLKESTARIKNDNEQLLITVKQERAAFETEKNKWKSIQDANESEHKQYERAEHNKKVALEWREAYSKYHKKSSDIIANQADTIQRQKATIDTLNQEAYVKDRKLQGQQADNKRIGAQLTDVSCYAAAITAENRILRSIVDKIDGGLSKKQQAALSLAKAEVSKTSLSADVKSLSQKIDDSIMLSVASIRDAVQAKEQSAEPQKAIQQKTRGIHRSQSRGRGTGR